MPLQGPGHAFSAIHRRVTFLVKSRVWVCSSLPSHTSQVACVLTGGVGLYSFAAVRSLSKVWHSTMMCAVMLPSSVAPPSQCLHGPTTYSLSAAISPLISAFFQVRRRPALHSSETLASPQLREPSPLAQVAVTYSYGPASRYG